jgi:squalene synthase HpnC
MSQVSAEAAIGFAGLPAHYAIPERAPSLADAQHYCERLARGHYENFSVATWFLPARLKQHFYNLYAYCRISDDLGDEVADKHEALRLLDQWEKELNATYECLADDVASDSQHDDHDQIDKFHSSLTVRNPHGPRHPVFVALRETIRQLDIPKGPFADLLVAFRSDQHNSRYETFEQVLGYCRYSANPVGRLVLYLCGYRDAERQQLSDYTCTALQLANFWQDIARDWDKGRIYLPLEDLRRFGVSEEDIAQRRATPEFLAMMKFEVTRAREWFDRGLPLAGKLDKELATDIELFTRGGQAILDAIERQEYDVLKQRPVISKPRKLGLVLRAGARKLFA